MKRLKEAEGIETEQEHGVGEMVRFTSVSGEIYGIWESGKEYIVLRQLSKDEYMEYYEQRRDELYVDEESSYWLLLHHTQQVEEARRCIGDILDLADNFLN